MAWRWSTRADKYFRTNWAAIRFQPILVLFMLGAGIRLWINDSEPIPFYRLYGEHFYSIWLGITVVSPMLVALAWWMIEKCSGRVRFLGMGVRLSADIGMLTSVLTYHVTVVLTNQAVSESKLFSRYMVGSVVLFLFALVIRDLWTLVVTERVARVIHRDGS